MRELTYDQAIDTILPQAARAAARKYQQYGLTFEDAQQEIWIWLYRTGRDGLTGGERVRRWLEQSPQRLLSIRKAMERYASNEGKVLKADAVGYKVHDNIRYSVPMVKELLSLALDGTFDGSRPPDGEFHGTSWSEELVAMVSDIRRAIEHCKTMDARTLVDFLNTEDYVGQRHAISNVTAQAFTGDTAENELVMGAKLHQKEEL